MERTGETALPTTEAQADAAFPPVPEAARSRVLACLVLAFLAEGVVGKFMRGDAALVPQSIHLLLTACGAALLVGLAASHRALGGRVLPVNAGVRPVRLCVLVMIVWGFLSSVAQVSFVAGNFAFWAVWAAHLVALWWAAPRLLQWDGLEERLRIIGLVLGGTVAATVLMAPWDGFDLGRFGGPFANPTTMGRIAALGLLFWLARLIARRGRDRFSAAMLLAACVLVALTRTRACVAAAVLGALTCLAVGALSSEGRARVRATRVAVVGLFCSALLGVSLLTVTDAGEVADFLRLQQGFNRIYSTARAMNWQAGMARLGDVGFFGNGFLSKFDPTHTHKVMGIVLPAYDWTTDRDPLNSVLGACQQTGWVGGALFVCFLALLIWRSLAAPPRVRPLLAGLCAAGLVWGLLDGNWLTSFGDPVDRLSLAIFALLLSAPQDAPAVAAERGQPCPI
jgi:hypothetical protein